MRLRLTYILIVLNVFAFGLILLLDNRKQSYDSKKSFIKQIYNKSKFNNSYLKNNNTVLITIYLSYFG